ncbi:HlyD family secretion protein [Bordetella genomosp. 1]|uniref:HlyD family secretion protein n=1 Tax=Bordetella genomosp. 1 TaxID=1395607 RepID=A0A261SUK8_9BORD|nr:HlyD family efflux transporter periplasmic adaptor subunit [Bordetella genomosp. 1]OZI40845.1 HlyD family secretion protein [Bordetella genomosp. 1]
MKKSLVWGGALVVVLVAAAAALASWANQRNASDLPAYIEGANGRLEASRIDIATKYAGRLEALGVREGDQVAAGAEIGRMDSAEVRTQLAAAQAARARAEAAVARAQAETEARTARERLAQIELKHTQGLRGDDLVSPVELSRRRLQAEGESAGVSAAGAAAGEARAAQAEAQAQIARVESVLDDMTLRAPVAGRIEYRIVEPGAVLPAGGRVVTLLNTADVYMTLFLPSRVAGALRLGQEGRIVMDGLNDVVFPAKVTFVASEAQFTPKYVETRSERDKLMFRVKLQIPEEVARKHAALLKAGMTGNGYVRSDPDAAWPARLEPRLPQE